MKLTSEEKKALGIYLVIVILVLILMGGNELGQFRNTDKADAKLDPVLYVICLSPILLFIRKRLNGFTVKVKVFTIIICIVLASFPMLLLSGLGKYIDYYTSDKHWTIENVTIINKSSSNTGRGGTYYRYRVQIKDTTMVLSSKVNCPVDQVFHLRICKTNLGMIIADKYYDLN